MCKKASIFVGVLLISSCHSVFAMGRYTKNLSFARSVRTALRSKRCAILIHPPLFMHAVVQAAQTTKHTKVFKEYIKEYIEDHGELSKNGFLRRIAESDAQKFYHHVVSYLPWDGTCIKGFSLENEPQLLYPLLLNGREVTVRTLCYKSCTDSTYLTDIMATNDDYWKDAKHHEKIEREFKKLMPM